MVVFVVHDRNASFDGFSACDTRGFGCLILRELVVTLAQQLTQLTEVPVLLVAGPRLSACGAPEAGEVERLVFVGDSRHHRLHAQRTHIRHLVEVLTTVGEVLVYTIGVSGKRSSTLSMANKMIFMPEFAACADDHPFANG